MTCAIWATDNALFHAISAPIVNAKITVHLTVERNGFVYMWHHADGKFESNLSVCR